MSDKTTSDHRAVPRRAFLAQASALGVATACGHAVLPALAGMNRLQASTFEARVGETFYLRGDKSGAVAVALGSTHKQTRDYGRPAHVRQESFSLIFHAPRGTVFADQLCRIEHPELSSIEAFVSAVDQPKRHVKLQAVFG